MRIFLKIIIFLCLSLGLHVSLFAGEFHLSSSFFNTLSSSKSKAIFKDYERFMNKISSKSLHVKIDMVNLYINAFVGVYDDLAYKQKDYWASRDEFLRNGGGDCEDYAIAKFYTLKELGIESTKMALCVVKERSSEFKHMVLLVWEDKKKEPLVLDNLSFKILPVSNRYDLHVEECMSEKGYFKFQNNTLVLNLSRRDIKSYVQMLQRSKEELLWQH